jgi:phosphate transport system permease protein
MIGFVGDMGGAHGARSIYKASDSRFGSDFLLGMLARGSAGIVLLMLGALIVVLAHAASLSIHQFGAHFLTSQSWAPEHEMQKRDAQGYLVKDEDGDPVTITVPGVFGALPVIYGTITSAVIALLIAVPLSLGAALFLVRIGPWLTPTFVKSGIVGATLILLLMAVPRFQIGDVALRGSRILSFLGALIGVAATLGLLLIAWYRDDPRVGPPRALHAFLHTAFPVSVFLIAMLGHNVLLWLDWKVWLVSLVFGAIAGISLGELGEGGVSILSFLIEFLAAIPSIAYGIWGLFVVAPFLQNYLEPALNRFFGWVPFLRFLHSDGGLTGRDMFSAGLILGIMIVPIITAIGRDVLRAVPRIQIEGTQAMGATWWQSSWAMLRYGRSGLFGAVMLGLARAAGETMAVAMVIGNAIQIKSSIFEPAQTMASLLANQFAEADTDLNRSALIEVALILLVMSLLFNVIARYLVVGKQVKTSG